MSSQRGGRGNNSGGRDNSSRGGGNRRSNNHQSDRGSRGASSTTRPSNNRGNGHGRERGDGPSHSRADSEQTIVPYGTQHARSNTRDSFWTLPNTPALAPARPGQNCQPNSSTNARQDLPQGPPTRAYRAPQPLQDRSTRNGPLPNFSHIFPRWSTPVSEPIVLEKPTLKQLFEALPDMDKAIGEFNSIPAAAPPFRDIPTDLLITIHRPLLSQPEPDWAAALAYFLTPNAIRGLENLEDLYLLLSRVVIPNLVVWNRHYLQEMYSAQPHLSSRMRLRYDEFEMTPQSQGEIGDTPVGIPASNGRRPHLALNTTANVPHRSIFRSYPTPDGDRFMSVLESGQLETWQGIRNTVRLGHRSSELDNHLTASETVVRRWNLGRLLQMVIRVLRIFWYIALCNDTLERYRKEGWKGMDKFNLPPGENGTRKNLRQDGGGKDGGSGQGGGAGGVCV